MGYKKAKGAIPWRDDDVSPEDMIRRQRGDCSDLETENARLRQDLTEARELLDWLRWHHNAHHAHYEKRDKGRAYSETENNRNLCQIDKVCQIEREDEAP